MQLRKEIRFFVNGREVTVSNADPEQTLGYFLRNSLQLKGTKLSCEEGACGACTVCIGRWNPDTKRARYASANACLMPLYLLDECSVITVEGISFGPGRPHPIQDRLARAHGTQCGFCSPGFVMSLYALLRNYPTPSKEQVDQAIRGNLCRCTGYRPIVESFYSFTQKNEGCCQGKGGDGCCKNQKQPKKELLLDYANFPPYDPNAELIFPPPLILSSQDGSVKDVIELNGKRVHLFVPSTLEQLLDIAQKNSSARFVSTGIMTRLIKTFSPTHIPETWISLQRIPELRDISFKDGVLRVGGAATITEFVEAIETHDKEKRLQAIVDIFKKYSSTHVRNTASWAGALASASGTSEVCSVTLALQLAIDILDVATREKKSLKVDETFFSGPRTVLTPTQVVTAISVRFDDYKDCQFFTFKHGKRLGADSTVLSASVLFRINGDRVKSANVVIGGIAKKQWIPQEFQKLLAGQKLSELKGTLTPFARELRRTYPTEEDSYRRNLAIAGLFKFFCSLDGTQDTIGLSDRNEFETTQIFQVKSG